MVDMMLREIEHIKSDEMSLGMTSETIAADFLIWVLTNEMLDSCEGCRRSHQMRCANYME